MPVLLNLFCRTDFSVWLFSLSIGHQCIADSSLIQCFRQGREQPIFSVAVFVCLFCDVSDYDQLSHYASTWSNHLLKCFYFAILFFYRTDFCWIGGLNRHRLCSTQLRQEYKITICIKKKKRESSTVYKVCVLGSLVLNCDADFLISQLCQRCPSQVQRLDTSLSGHCPISFDLLLPWRSRRRKWANKSPFSVFWRKW